MARQDANATFAATSFLHGGNAAYIEQLYARYERDPSAVDATWREFFEGLKDSPGSAVTEAEGPAWRRPDWPITANGELVSALDGNWQAIVNECYEAQFRREPIRLRNTSSRTPIQTGA